VAFVWNLLALSHCSHPGSLIQLVSIIYSSCPIESHVGRKLNYSNGIQWNPMELLIFSCSSSFFLNSLGNQRESIKIKSETNQSPIPEFQVPPGRSPTFFFKFFKKFVKNCLEMCWLWEDGSWFGSFVCGCSCYFRWIGFLDGESPNSLFILLGKCRLMGFFHSPDFHFETPFEFPKGLKWNGTLPSKLPLFTF
jgi:hypothetical protein